jgi:3-methylfumaryl-CoA hydratase
MDLDYLNQWLGKEQVVEAVISADTANLMQATLNRDPSLKTGDELPPAWNWLYFHEPIRADNLDVEGHAQLGGFMPPISFGNDEPPRRMWAGGKFVFNRSILLGDQATKRSTVKSITPKEGRSGRLVFVMVEHELLVDGECCLLEEQTIVYREPVQSSGGAVVAKPAPMDGEFSAAYHPDPIMLFRYSALTFNSHRIHYDVDFCRNHEGYPDLVVQGPLTATPLLDLFYHQFPDKRIVGFEYRGRSPLFSPHPFTVHGKADGQAWASDHIGGLAMSAQVSVV